MAAKKTKNQLLKLEDARWQLALVWFPVCAFLFLILVIQSLLGAYGADLQRVWGWALPHFLPTLALMISIFSADALKPASDTETYVRRNFLQIAFWLSTFYLAMVLLSILAPPFVNHFRQLKDSIPKVTVLETSNFWLAPLQGLAVSSIGVLFFLKEEKAGTMESESTPSADP